MKITLRQAHKLIDKINSRLATITISAVQQVNIWEVDDTSQTYDNLKAAFSKQCDRNRELVSARQCIRNQIRIANQKGIDEAVADRKAAMDELGFLRHQLNTVNDSAINTSAALARKLDAEREAAKLSSTNHYRGNSDVIAVCLYSPEDLEQLDKQINAAQLEVEKHEDRLSKLNSTLEIELQSNVSETLRQEGLI